MLEEGSLTKLCELSFLVQDLEAPCALLAPCFQAFWSEDIPTIPLLPVVNHGPKIMLSTRVAGPSLFFFCQAELITPIRNCSVDTELIDKVNCVEQEFCIYKKNLH